MSNFRNAFRGPSPQELHLDGGCRFLQRADRIPLSTSAFTIGSLTMGIKYVVMVLNTEERRPDGSIKPAGWGLPGGGIKEGEDPSVAAIREFQAETGLTATNPRWKRYEHDLLAPRSGNGFYYNKCHLFMSQGGDISRITRQTLIHIFVAEIIFEGPVADMLRLRRALCPTEDIIIRLDSELGEKLQVEEARTKEIEAIGLFPVAELLDSEKPKEGFYGSHLSRIARVLEVPVQV